MTCSRLFRVVGLAALLIIPVSAWAQERPVVPLPPGPGRISGGVLGADSLPLNAAAITIRLAGDSAIVAGVLTSKEGRFRVDGLPLGKYLVHISHIGHTSANVSDVALTATAPAKDVGILRLQVAPVALRALEVQGERSAIQLQADRTVYDPKAIPAAAGGSAADLLRAIDELEVDFNGKVQMAGNRPVAIHLNGRPAPMRGEQLDRFLTQLSGRLVSKVEVMPNPSAAHDPEGMGGIVNIVLKENVDLGLSGSFGVNADSRGNRGLNTRLAFQKGRFTFFGGGSGSIGSSAYRMYDLRQNLLSTPVTFFEQEGTSDYESRFGFGDFSSEFKLARQTILWANGYAYGSGSESRGNVLFAIYDEQEVDLDRYLRLTSSNSDNVFHDIGIGLKHQFVPQRHELTIDLRDNSTDSHSAIDALKDLQMPGADPGRELTANDTDNGVGALTFKADYIRPWRQRGNISMGVSIWRRETDEESRQRIFAEEHDAQPGFTSSTDFLHRETIRAFYLTASQTFGKYNLMAGVRGEFAATEFTLGTTGESFDNDYRSVFPNFSISRELAPGRTLRVGYSKRVGRPPTYYLNPYRPTTDPLNRSEGNPELKPNYTHSINADFSWIGSRGTLRVSPYYLRTVDNWDQIRTVDTAGVSVTRPENVASVARIGTGFTIGLRPQARLGGSINFSVFHVKNDATNISAEYTNAAWRWSTSSNLSAKLTPALSATSNLMYSPPRDTPQGHQSAYIYSTIGLRQQLFNQKATLNAYVNDPLDIYRSRFESRDRTHIQLSRTVPRMRAATIGLTYNFGKPPQQHSRRDAADTGQMQQQ